MPVSLTEYHKSRVCPALMYMQHMHMVCGEKNISHDLILYQTVNDNTYSTPLLHEALDVDHQMVMMGIGLYHNTFSHLCVQYQHYPEYDTLCLSILFTGSFIYFTLSMAPCLRCSLDRFFWGWLYRLASLFFVQ